ncbi:MAG: flagellar type III secretion system pore protein FliP [Sneathiellaceae bacterium]|uniref:flagellar type III secretion system pore protein FliP n=1 Tax=Marinovum algicola TaxID=42444 RepID=UPI0032F84EBF
MTVAEGGSAVPRRRLWRAGRVGIVLLPALLAGLALILATVPAAAQTLNLDLGQDGTLTGRVVQLLALMTVLSLAPSILIVATSFTRIVVVLSLLRSAIGVQSTPPNIVMISLALFLTFFIMEPVLQQAYDEGLAPLIDEQITEEQALQRIVAPFRAFMLRHVRSDDLQTFANMAGTVDLAATDDLPLRVLMPAFMISELRRGFEIGFLIFVPFLVIDMVVASVLMSMGMMMLPPVIIALPFKVVFFVLVDGWNLVAGSLVQSFAGGAP